MFSYSRYLYYFPLLSGKYITVALAYCIFMARYIGSAWMPKYLWVWLTAQRVNPQKSIFGMSPVHFLTSVLWFVQLS